MDDYHTRFAGLVTSCDPRPSDQNQAAIFLRNFMLPGMSKQRLLSDIAVGYYRSLSDVYKAAKAVSMVPASSMGPRPVRGGYAGAAGRGMYPPQGRGGRFVPRGGRTPGRGTAPPGRGGAVSAMNNPYLVCWHCGQSGHRRQDCPELRRVQAHAEGAEQGEQQEAQEGATEVELRDMSALRLSRDSPESF